MAGPALDMVQQWLLLLVAATVALAFYLAHRKQGGKQLRLPPGPPGLPVFGNLGIFVRSSHPHQELDRLSQLYGPLMSLRMGSKQALVVSSSEMAQQVLKTFDKEFADRPYTTAKDALGYGDDTMGFSSYSPHWRFIRKTATLELLTLKRVHQFESIRAEELSSMLGSIFKDSQRSLVVDMNQRLAFMLMNIMTRILMHNRFFSYSAGESTNHAEEELASEFKSLIEEGFFLGGVAVIGDVIPYLGFLDKIKNYKGAMKRVHKRFDSFFAGVLEDHRKHQQESIGNSERDFADILLSLPGQDGTGKLSDSIIKALLMDMLVAGTDTASVTTEWSLSELLRHPDLLHKLQAELDAVVGKDRVVLESDVPDLPYLQAVVKEVFRLHPPAPLLIPHQSSRECQIAGYDIPAGTATFINVWSIGRNSDSWDKPLQFVPERFATRDTDVRGQHFELLPFGSGRRGCPGMHLGLAVVQYALARLVHSFDWTLPDGQAPHHLDMAEKFGLTVPRATPLMAVPRPRLPPHLYSF